jgi:hypothetical protein
VVNRGITIVHRLVNRARTVKKKTVADIALEEDLLRVAVLKEERSTKQSPFRRINA